MFIFIGVCVTVHYYRRDRVSVHFLYEREGVFIFMRKGGSVHFYRRGSVHYYRRERVSVHFYRRVWDCSLL